MPENSLTVYGEITKIATFEYFDTKVVNNELFGLDELELEPYSTFFERLGHESTLFIDNIGVPIYVLCALLIGQLLKLLFIRIPFIERRLDKFTNVNILQRYYLQTYYDYALYSMIEVASKPL